MIDEHKFREMSLSARVITYLLSDDRYIDADEETIMLITKNACLYSEIAGSKSFSNACLFVDEAVKCDQYKSYRMREWIKIDEKYQQAPPPDTEKKTVEGGVQYVMEGLKLEEEAKKERQNISNMKSWEPLT